MVKENGDLVLIDYDSMYVDSLDGYIDEIKGLPGYQHPSRFKQEKLSPKSDYFSQLIIYTGIIAFSEEKDLWNKYKDTEDFLFSQKETVHFIIRI